MGMACQHFGLALNTLFAVAEGLLLLDIGLFVLFFCICSYVETVFT